MGKYSLDFLRQEWDGKGYDFCFACVFSSKGMSKESVSNLVRNVITYTDSFKLKYISENDGQRWQSLPGCDVGAFMDDLESWKSILLFVFEVTTKFGFSGYVELSQPNHMIVGGAAESFYSGDTARDILIAQDVMNLVGIGIDAFGTGYGSFGAGSAAIQTAEKLRDSGSNANLSSSTNLGVFAESIAAMCSELRLL